MQRRECFPGGAGDDQLGIVLQQEEEFSGQKVSRIAFAVDPKTGTMRAEIDVPNPKGQLRPGMSAYMDWRTR